MGTRPVSKTKDPAVILDIVCEDGMLAFRIANVTDSPVYSVRIKFEQPVIGMDGKTDLTGLAIFSRLEFLAPRRTLDVPIDRVPAFFARRRGRRIACTVSYTDAFDKAFVSQIRHDVSIYRDLICLPFPPSPQS